MLGLSPEGERPVPIDPLDFQLDRLGAAPERVRRTDPWQTRLAISWSTGSFPAVLLLVLGTAFGPLGLGLLTPGVLALIDPAVTLALAALGVVVGLGIPRRPGDGRLFAAASVEATATALMVAAGLYVIVPAVANTSELQTWILAAAAGICASTSSALPAVDLGARAPEVRVKDLDARLPILAGAVLLAVLHGGSVEAGLLLAGQAVVIAMVIAGAGWLLLTGTTSETEQRVFAVAALLLIGGVADYLSLSALLSGVIAGALWQAVGGGAREAIARDIGYVQHPLAVILLVVAGAQVVFTADVVAVGVAYVLLRTAGKLLGGWLARGAAGHALPRRARLHLTSPGIFGVAFAMNAVRALGPDAAALVTIVAIGTVGSQLVSALDSSAEDRS